MTRCLIFFRTIRRQIPLLNLKKTRTCKPDFASFRVGLFLIGSGARLDIPAQHLTSFFFIFQNLDFFYINDFFIFVFLIILNLYLD
jgi:hypothetical protein